LANRQEFLISNERPGPCDFPLTLFCTSEPVTTGFGSLRVVGRHFLMGDETVRFVSQNVDMNTDRRVPAEAD
jgi:hypothetical protein